MVGTKLKPLAVMGITMSLLFILRNTYRLSILEWINPWTYVVKLVVPFSSDTNFHTLPYFYWQTLVCFVILFILYTIISIVIGIKLFNT